MDKIQRWSPKCHFCETYVRSGVVFYAWDNNVLTPERLKGLPLLICPKCLASLLKRSLND